MCVQWTVLFIYSTCSFIALIYFLLHSHSIHIYHIASVFNELIIANIYHIASVFNELIVDQRANHISLVLLCVNMFKYIQNLLILIFNASHIEHKNSYPRIVEITG